MTTLSGLIFTLASGEQLTEDLAQKVLDEHDCCPLDWSPLEEHAEPDGDESGTYMTQWFECTTFGHSYRYEYVDRESGRPVLEDALEQHADDARPFPLQRTTRDVVLNEHRFVPWGVALRAFKSYDRLFPGTTVGRIAERGGFGEKELAVFLANPKTYEEMRRLFSQAGRRV